MLYQYKAGNWELVDNKLTFFGEPDPKFYQFPTEYKCSFGIDVGRNKLKETIMSVIKSAFKSKENKALERYELGTTCELNSQGFQEFLTYVYETDKVLREGFLAKMVEAYEEEKKNK